jgi:hypothetical protein
MFRYQLSVVATELTVFVKDIRLRPWYRKSRVEKVGSG